MQCPVCGRASPVRLAPEQRCAACASAAAWRAAGEADVLKIDRAAIAAAVQRRAGVARPWWRKLPWATALPCAAAALATAQLAAARAPRALAPLAQLLEDLQRTSGRAALAGLIAMVLGAAALLLARRARRPPLPVPIFALHLLAIITGAVALIGGGAMRWLGAGAATQHVAMPPFDDRDASDPERRIAGATAVLLAPDRHGDAGAFTLGAGAVIARDAQRAWIITCSHVAMPYAAVSSRRRPADAHPVWVQLADGRGGPGRVRWLAAPPLDVALIELPIERAPEPAPLAPDAEELRAGDAVTFAPNPYRAGWLFHRGQILLRDAHQTPAGRYQLLLTDLPAIPGDSGSGLYDDRGRLIGLTTWAVRGGDDSQNDSPMGLSHGLALPVEALRPVIEAIAAGRLDQLAAGEPPRSQASRSPPSPDSRRRP